MEFQYKIRYTAVLLFKISTPLKNGPCRPEVLWTIYYSKLVITNDMCFDKS